MTLRNLSIGIVLASIALLPSLTLAAGPEQSAAEFLKGNELLQKADFNGALKAYAAAARADGTKVEYRQQYSILRQVITLREALPKEKNAEKWQSTAMKLRGFYYMHGLYSEALPLDEQLYSRVKTPEAAANLAGTHLAMGKNAEAEKLLGGIEEAKATPQTKILLGIAMARQDKMDAAKALSGKIELPKDAGPGLVYDLACLKALAGQKGDAVGLLIRAFQNTPPSRLEAMKNAAKEDKDFAGIAKSPEFATALTTVSKMPESGCSGGSSCGSCASKGKCASAKTGGTAAGCTDHAAKK